MHNLLLHLARMEIARRKDRRCADDLEIRLRASLPSSRTPSGCRRPPGASKVLLLLVLILFLLRCERDRGGVSQLVFTNRLCQTFAISMCLSADRSRRVASPRGPESLDGWQIFNPSELGKRRRGCEFNRIILSLVECRTCRTTVRNVH